MNASANLLVFVTKLVKAAATAPQSIPKGAIMGLLDQQGFSSGPKRPRASYNDSQKGSRKISKVTNKLQRLPKRLPKDFKTKVSKQNPILISSDNINPELKP